MRNKRNFKSGLKFLSLFLIIIIATSVSTFYKSKKSSEALINAKKVAIQERVEITEAIQELERMNLAISAQNKKELKELEDIKSITLKSLQQFKHQSKINNEYITDYENIKNHSSDNYSISAKRVLTAKYKEYKQ